MFTFCLLGKCGWLFPDGIKPKNVTTYCIHFILLNTGVVCKTRAKRSVFVLDGCYKAANVRISRFAAYLPRHWASFVQLARTNDIKLYMDRLCTGGSSKPCHIFTAYTSTIPKTHSNKSFHVDIRRHYYHAWYECVCVWMSLIASK